MSRGPLAFVALVAQVLFTITWLVAASWQGSAYDAVAHSISDMYADNAPLGVVFLIVLPICGLVTILFALFSLRPTLRPGGWTATVGSVLLALSIFGLGDLLTPWERLACRIADAGCTADSQLATAGGQLDTALSTAGFMLLIAAGFFLAQAMVKTEGWSRWAWPTRIVSVLLAVLFAVDGFVAGAGLGGLFERLLALVGAAAIAALAVGVIRSERARA